MARAETTGPDFPRRAPPRSGAPRARAIAFAVASAALLVVYTTRHPFEGEPPIASRLFSPPSLAKAATLLRVLATIAALDVAALGAGRTALRALRVTAADALDRFAVGLLVLSTGVLGLAALHALGALSLWALLAAGALQHAWPDAESWAERARAVRRGLLAWPIVLALAPAALASMIPLHGWDALTYHLAIPEWYLRENRVVVTPYSLVSAYPHHVEMLYALALKLQGPELARMIHVELGAATALAAYRATLRMASPRMAALAVVLLLSEPVVRKVVELAYTDLAACLYALLAVRALDRWRVSPSAHQLALVGALAGGAFATRYSGGSIPIVIALEIALLAWRLPSPPRWAHLSAFPAAALAVASPWLARNALLTGNPIAPIGQSWLSATPFFDPLVVTQQRAFLDAIGMGRAPTDALLLPWNLSMRSVEGRYAGSFGWQFGLLPVCGVLAVAAARRLPPAATSAVRVTAGLTAVFFVTIQEGRYLLPALAIFSCACAAAVGRLIEPLTERQGAAVAAPLVVAGVLSVAPEAVRLPWIWHYALGRGKSASFEMREPAAKLAVTLRDRIAPGERALLLFEPRSYLFRGIDHVPYHLNEGSLVMREVTRSSGAADLAAFWYAERVRWLVVEDGPHDAFHPSLVEGYSLAQWRRDESVVRDLLRLYATEEQRIDSWALFRLRPP